MRPQRVDIADFSYHILNRSNGKIPLFTTDADFIRFEQVLEKAKEKFAMRIYTYCIMPNHWHLIVNPRKDGDLSKFMQWLTLTHTQRIHSANETAGNGHIYQGRYKAFLIQTDEYFLTACRYVEQNPLRANLVQNSLDWRWGSLWRREYGTLEQVKLLDEWTTPRPSDYSAWVNEREWDDRLPTLRQCVNKELPFGKSDWKRDISRRYGVRFELKKPGPRSKN